jgi:hypothetical protein
MFDFGRRVSQNGPRVEFNNRRMNVAKEKMNKSQVIRDALKANKGKSPTEIAAMLNEKHGLSLTGQYVSTVKSNARKTRKIIRNVRRMVRRAGRGGIGTNDLSGVRSAVDFVKAVGGMEAAKAALATVEEIGNAVR